MNHFRGETMSLFESIDPGRQAQSQTQIQAFNFDGVVVRTVVGDDGAPLFVGKDVCETLGYSNPAKAMQDHCKG